MVKHRKLVAALVLAGLASADAHASTMGPTGRAGTSIPINTTSHCAGGGTRSVVGTYDPESGALNVTTTLTACVGRNNRYAVHGTAVTTGTLLAPATELTIDVTATVDTTTTRSDGATVTRPCTTRTKGTFTHATQTFDGTTTRTNCSVTGKLREQEGLVKP